MGARRNSSIKTTCQVWEPMACHSLGSIPILASCFFCFILFLIVMLLLFLHSSILSMRSMLLLGIDEILDVIVLVLWIGGCCFIVMWICSCLKVIYTIVVFVKFLLLPYCFICFVCWIVIYIESMIYFECEIPYSRIFSQTFNIYSYVLCLWKLLYIAFCILSYQ